MNPQGRKIWYPAIIHIHHNYWKEGQEQPKMIAYTIVASPYIKITPRIEPRPPNPSCDIDTTMIEDSAISTTYNLRLLFNPSYTVPTIDLPSRVPFADDATLVHYKPALTIGSKLNWFMIGENIYYHYLLPGWYGSRRSELTPYWW